MWFNYFNGYIRGMAEHNTRELHKHFYFQKEFISSKIIVQVM